MTTPAAPPPRYGVEGAQRAMNRGGGGRFPELWIKDGEIAAIHSLSTGGDPLFAGAQFHPVGEGAKTRDVVCLRMLTAGDETCNLCSNGHTDLRNRFGLWVWVYRIDHMSDKPPDQEGDLWALVDPKPDDPDQRRRFREIVKKARVLRLSAGRDQSNFRQFTAEYTAHGSLQKFAYKLARVGAGLDTTYVLSPLNEKVLDKEIADLIPTLASMEEVFRDTLTQALPVPSLGSDQVLGPDNGVVGDGLGDEPLPTAATPPASADDLI